MNHPEIDLREVKLLMKIEETLHVEGGVGVINFHRVGLPKGTYEIAQLLAVAGFERFVTNLFLEAARIRLNLNEGEVERYRDNSKRLLANPSPEVIEKCFGYIGIFDVFQTDCEIDQRIRSRLGTILTERNRVAHGNAIDRFDVEPAGTWSGSLFTSDPRDRKEAIVELIDFFEGASNRLTSSIHARLT